ncbi:hypothetical protein MHYP_G00064800 [Metynnis hypsauchen]
MLLTGQLLLTDRSLCVRSVVKVARRSLATSEENAARATRAFWNSLHYVSKRMPAPFSPTSPHCCFQIVLKTWLSHLHLNNT